MPEQNDQLAKNSSPDLHKSILNPYKSFAVPRNHSHEYLTRIKFY